MKHTKHPKRLLAGSIIAVATTAVAMTGLGLSASATTASHAQPHAVMARPTTALNKATIPTTQASNPVVAEHQEFGSNTTDFCPNGSGNAACDGAANDYGTIDRVTGGFSNGGSGNYAPSTAAYFGNWMAVVSGTGDVNQGQGCPGTTATSNPGETCSGPYALFGSGAAQGAENVFPHNGFTVTDDLYLSPTTAPVAGSLVDNDVELNNSTGGYGIDNITTACYESGGFVINFGNGSPGSCAGTPVITSDGWYRFVTVFSNVAGYAYVTESVLSEPSLTQVATSGPLPVGGGAATAASTWGGPGYFWLPTEDMSGLPLANFALQLGSHTTGYTP